MSPDSRILSYLDLYGSRLSAVALQLRALNPLLSSRIRLHCHILCRGEQAYARVELGVESLPQFEPQVPEKSETIGTYTAFDVPDVLGVLSGCHCDAIGRNQRAR